ncbi:MAG: 1-acyl-sn-glycerol-3-phosphate acyltransferase, partial [Gemmatimonadota bacterium]|nr:1-acyl-sn-glycerol-3-phosphate acyltransferase [Gemmatimonadota bacterium]
IRPGARPLFKTMSTFRAYIALIGGTLVFGTMVLLAQLFRVDFKRGGIFDMAPRWWTRGILGATGVQVIRHNAEVIVNHKPYVYIANHVSWYDILALLDALPNFGFVAKRELEKIPLFGPAARAVGVIYIDRDNRKAAFNAYEDASKRIRDGASVVVYPEGTRGESYALRPFKKGPFVLAIQAGVPIVPVIVFGTIAVNPKGSFKAHPGTVHVHLLDPIPTEGLTYDQRDELCERVRTSMGVALRDLYGVNPSLIGAPDKSSAIAPVQATA